MTRRINEASRILDLKFKVHVIVGTRAPSGSPYFSFKEGIDLAMRTGWPEPAHPLRKQLLTVHDKLEADIAARDEKAIAYATGMLRGEIK
jgi:hypothetical protein